VEAGAWVLALAGLLEGRQATTHWEDLEDFTARFPGIDVRPNRFVVDGDRFTTGGASPALDMMLELIRIRQGYALALSVASVFIYDRAHTGEDPQPSVSLGSLGWYEPRVAAAIRAMEERIDRPLPIAAIAARLGIGVRTLETQFQQHVGLSPRAYYGQMRLEAGRRMVLETCDDMSSVAARCGFHSASAFARAFRERYGSSPSSARAARRGQ
jgi:transcriptional regulator GlxA family with amidase domain